MVIFLTVVFGSLVLAYLFAKWIEWDAHVNSYSAKISFDSFKKFYEINPNRWITGYGTVTCRTAKETWEENDTFCFDFFDYYKYRKWIKQKEKNKKSTRNAEAIKRMMDVVREDIADQEAASKKMSNNAIDEVINIIRESDWEDADAAILILRQIKELNRRNGNANNH